jgi:hypothetical protein
MLLSLFGIKNPPLSQADIDRLRAIATSQGNFKTTASNADVWPSGTQAVLFYDLTNSSGNVNLNTIRGFGHTAGILSEPLPRRRRRRRRNGLSFRGGTRRLGVRHDARHDI